MQSSAPQGPEMGNGDLTHQRDEGVKCREVYSSIRSYKNIPRFQHIVGHFSIHHYHNSGGASVIHSSGGESFDWNPLVGQETNCILFHLS